MDGVTETRHFFCGDLEMRGSTGFAGTGVDNGSVEGMGVGTGYWENECVVTKVKKTEQWQRGGSCILPI